MANKPLTEEYVKSLEAEAARAEAEKHAIIEEFTKQINEKGELFDEEDIKAKIKEVLPLAFQTLKHLLANSESDSTRAMLVKYVFDASLVILKKQAVEEEKEDSVGQLIKELAMNDEKPKSKYNFSK